MYSFLGAAFSNLFIRLMHCSTGIFKPFYQIDACDIPLKSYENCETFYSVAFSQIPYDLRADLKILKSISVTSVFVLFFGSCF
jgi:hypothetical protein